MTEALHTARTDGGALVPVASLTLPVRRAVSSCLHDTASSVALFAAAPLHWQVKVNNFGDLSCHRYLVPDSESDVTGTVSGGVVVYYTSISKHR